MVGPIRGRCLTLCSAFLLRLEPPLLFCRARGQRTVRPAGVPQAVRMITVFGGAAKLHCRAGAGDRPAGMMRAEVQETNGSAMVSRGRSADLGGVGKERKQRPPKRQIRCVARKSVRVTWSCRSVLSGGHTACDRPISDRRYVICRGWPEAEPIHLRLSEARPARTAEMRPATLRALRRTASAVMPASCATCPSSDAIIAVRSKARLMRRR